MGVKIFTVDVLHTHTHTHAHTHTAGVSPQVISSVAGSCMSLACVCVCVRVCVRVCVCVCVCSGAALTWEKHRWRMLVLSLFRALVKRYLFRFSPQNSLWSRWGGGGGYDGARGPGVGGGGG